MEQETGTHNCRQQKEVRQKLHVRNVRMLAQAMEFDSIPVINVTFRFLGDSKVLVVVKPPHVPNRLS